MVSGFQVVGLKLVPPWSGRAPSRKTTRGISCKPCGRLGETCQRLGLDENTANLPIDTEQARQPYADQMRKGMRQSFAIVDEA